MKNARNIVFILCLTASCKARDFNQTTKVKHLEFIPPTAEEEIASLVKRYDTENAAPSQVLSDRALTGFYLKKGLRLSKAERKAFSAFAKDNVIFPQVHCMTRSNCKELGIVPSDEAVQTAKLMLGVFDRIPPLENSFSVYMGLPTTGDSYAINKSKTEKDIRFLSTSRDREKSKSFLFGTPEIGGSYKSTAENLRKHGLMKEFLLPQGTIAFPMLYIAYAHLLDAADKAANKNNLSDEEIEGEKIAGTVTEEEEVLLHPCATYKYFGTNSEYEFSKSLKLVGSNESIKPSLTVHPFRYIAEPSSPKKMSECLPKQMLKRN